MSTGELNCMKSPNSKENRLLKEEPNIEVSDVKQKTSSDLLYCEYVDTSSERVSKLFEEKKEKPVMVSYGESPFYKKYSDLLKELEKSKDVLPPECDGQLPVIEMEVFVKQNIDNDSDSSDAEESRIIFCGEKDDSSDDKETSDSETEDQDTVLTKMNEKMQIISKENKLCIEHEEINNSDSSTADCELNVSCKSVSDKNNIDSSNFEPTPKKLRLK